LIFFKVFMYMVSLKMSHDTRYIHRHFFVLKFIFVSKIQPGMHPGKMFKKGPYEGILRAFWIFCMECRRSLLISAHHWFHTKKNVRNYQSVTQYVYKSRAANNNNGSQICQRETKSFEKFITWSNMIRYEIWKDFF
jgi:hypothetical protein